MCSKSHYVRFRHCPEYICSSVILTLFHHANVNTTFESACLAVASVVLGDGATAVKRTCEGGLALHTAPKEMAYILKSAKCTDISVQKHIFLLHF